MQVTSTSFRDGGIIPAEYAFCAIDAKTHATLSQNRNPQLAWSGAPAGTKSFAIVCLEVIHQDVSLGFSKWQMPHLCLTSVTPIVDPDRPRFAH